MKNDLLKNKLISQCGVQIHFNQNLPDDTELIVRSVMSGNFTFAQLFHDVERWGGSSFIPMTEHSESIQQGENWAETNSLQKTNSTTQSTSTQTGSSVGNGQAESLQEGGGEVNTLSQPVIHGTRPEQKSKALSKTTAHGLTRNTTTAQTTSNGTTNGTTEGTAVGKSDQKGGSLNKGLTISHKMVQVQNPPVVKKQATGQLETAFNDQLEKLKQWPACLPKRHAIVSVPWEAKAFEIVTVDVPDPFKSIEAQMKAVEWVKRELYAIHPYYFTPDLTEEEGERRLREFLGEAPEPEPDIVVQDGEVQVEPEMRADFNPYGN